MVLRSAFIVDGPLVLRSQRLTAARESATGRDILTLPLLAARLAGGFIAPISTDVLYPAIQGALAGGGFKDISSVAHLPGMPRAVLHVSLSETQTHSAVIGTRPPFPPHQTRPSFGQEAPFLGLMGASVSTLVLSVPVAGDAPASSVAGASTRRPRLARPKDDGGNNASADNQRTNAPDADRALHSCGADHRRDADLPRRLTEAHRRVHHLEQYPLGSNPASSYALVTQSPLPAPSGGGSDRD